MNTRSRCRESVALRTLIAFVVIAAMAISLVACASAETTQPAEEPVPEPTHALAVLTRGDWNYFVDIPLDGSETTTLTPRFAGLGRCAAAFDGSTILYSLDPRENSTITTPSLHAFDVASGEDTTLSSGSFVGACSWTPSNEPVAFLYDERPILQPPGSALNRRLVRFSPDSAEETSVVLATVPDSDDPLSAGPNELSVIAADDSWLYLLEGANEWKRSFNECTAYGLWRVPIDGGTLEQTVKFADTYAVTMRLAGQDMYVRPKTVNDPFTMPLRPSDTVTIQLSYATGCGDWHSSEATTVDCPVRSYRISDGEIVAETTVEQTFQPMTSDAPPEGERVVTTLRDPYMPERRLEARSRYLPMSNLALYEVTREGESLIASSSPTEGSASVTQPVRYLPSGDFLYFTTETDTQRLERYERVSGESTTLCRFEPSMAEGSWRLVILGAY